jgi:hypothetical protein
MGDFAGAGQSRRRDPKNGWRLDASGKTDARDTQGAQEALRYNRRSHPVRRRDGISGTLQDRLPSLIRHVGEFSPSPNKTLRICFCPPFKVLGEFSPKTLPHRRIFAQQGMNRSQHSERESAANNPLEPLLDEYEYARITGRSVASARRDRLLGKGCPYVKLSALVRYRPSDVRAFLAANVHGGQKAGVSE